MKKHNIIELLRSEKKTLTSKFGVEEIGVFGSYARGEETSDSDVDILITFKKPSFDSLMGAYLYLEKVLNKKVDLVTKHKHLSSRFLKIIEKEIIYA
ncbi:MAG: nucleotidyltransferase family protein [Bacteroidota bacterium]